MDCNLRAVALLLPAVLGALLREEELVFTPIELIEQYLNIEIDESRMYDHGLEEWLNKMAQIDIDLALEGVEKLITYALSHTIYLSNYDDHLTQLLTRAVLVKQKKENQSIMERCYTGLLKYKIS